MNGLSASGATAPLQTKLQDQARNGDLVLRVENQQVLAELAAALGEDSAAAVINTAVSALKWVVDRIREDKKVIAVSVGTETTDGDPLNIPVVH